MMNRVGDNSRLFMLGLGASWAVVVALPLLASLATGRVGHGVPLLGVVLWIALLRGARWISPAARADALMRRGAYGEALALADEALAITGDAAWIGQRRLVWLNRRTAALLGLGRVDVALAAATEAIDFSADPETVGNLALALLRLNRYDEAAGAARLALSLTRERSLAGNAVLATVMLTRRMPAEAEALARAGLADARALLPLIRPEPYAFCLVALSRASLAQDRKEGAEDALRDLRVAGQSAVFVRAMALAEEISGLDDTPENRERALTLLTNAFELAPDYIYWYVTQPDTLTLLRDDDRFKRIRADAYARFADFATSAPTLEIVALSLASAQKAAHTRPAVQASRGALLMQVLTLAGTFALLIWWAWRFFFTNL